MIRYKATAVIQQLTKKAEAGYPQDSDSASVNVGVICMVI